MPKDIMLDAPARAKLMQGIDTVANAVKNDARSQGA